LAAGAFGARAALRRSPAQGATVSAGPPKKGGELRVAFDGAAIITFVLDPHHSLFAPHCRILRSIFDNLTELLPDGSVAPWLAESWELSPDRRTYTFALRRGVTFHDGTPFDGAAVKANFDRIADPTHALYAKSSLGPYVGTEVLAADRVRVTFREPYTPFLRHLSMTKLAIVSPAAVAKFGAVFGQNPVGTGPFRFAGLVQGTEIQLERNPDYRWGPRAAPHQGPPYLEKLTFRNVPDEATRVSVLQSGEALAADLIPPQHLPGFRADPRFVIHEQELLNTNYSLALNTTREPWNDDEVRRAVRLSLDIDAIVRSIYLGAFPRAWSPLSPSIFASAEHDLAGSWRPDPARAAEILDRKGWARGPDGTRQKNGQPLRIRFIDTQGNREKRLDVIQVVRHQLASNGVGLVVDSEPSGAYAAKVGQGDYDLTAGAQFHSDPEVLRLAYSPELRSPLAGNKVVDPELVEWLDQGSREVDGPARAEWYRRAQGKIVDKDYGIPIYVLIYNVVTDTRVRGVALDAHGFPDLRGAWLEG
jgi:peptide/nickel transport system substrate-binding protein